jgi:hypothetical protein
MGTVVVTEARSGGYANGLDWAATQLEAMAANLMDRIPAQMVAMGMARPDLAKRESELRDNAAGYGDAAAAIRHLIAALAVDYGQVAGGQRKQMIIHGDVMIAIMTSAPACSARDPANILVSDGLGSVVLPVDELMLMLLAVGEDSRCPPGLVNEYAERHASLRKERD